MLMPIRTGTARRLGLRRRTTTTRRLGLAQPPRLPGQGMVLPVWVRVIECRGNEYLIDNPASGLFERWHFGSQGPLRQCTRETDHQSGMCDR